MFTRRSVFPTRSQLSIQVLTLFPEAFPGTAGISLTGRALKKGLWRIDCINIRDFAKDSHGTVDGEPFGGGAGMVMRPDVMAKAIDFANRQHIDKKNRRILCLSPRGTPFEQKMAEELVTSEALTIICGRYEGIDERILSTRSIEEVSLGDFVLSGGEQAALILIDAVVRLLPGVLGAENSLSEESFVNNLLEYPQYTKPQIWDNQEVPSVLLSGHHEKIRRWRQSQAEAITKRRRPDLWQRYIANHKIG